MSDQNGTGGTAGTAPGTPSTPGQGGAAVIIDGPGLYATADGREVEVTAQHGECWRGHLGRNLGWWRYEASGELAGMPEHPDRIVRKLPTPTPAPSPVAEVDELLRAARAYVADAAEPQSGYGGFPGGDPRNFHPDYESCSRDEIAAHDAACKAAEEAEARGASPNRPCESGWVSPSIHISKSSFGIGGYTYQDEEAVALLAKIDAALARATRTEGGAS